MSKKHTPSQIKPLQAKNTSHNRYSRVGDLIIPGVLKPGQVVVGKSQFFDKWFVYRITDSLKPLTSRFTFTNQQEAQHYASQWTYTTGRWFFSLKVYIPQDDSSFEGLD